MLHGVIVSAIADSSSQIYRGRAFSPAERKKWGMADDGWRKRLEAVISKDGRTLREISLASGLSHGYLHGILRDGKEPTLDRFIRICKEINVSLAYALVGADITPETEAVIQALEEKPTKRAAILQILKD